MSNNEQLVGILSYITIIGWIIAFLMKSNDKKGLGRYHLRQALLLGIVGLIVSLLSGVLEGVVANILHVIILIFAILGIISAANKEKKPLPLIGEKSQELFAGL